MGRVPYLLWGGGPGSKSQSEVGGGCGAGGVCGRRGTAGARAGAGWAETEGLCASVSPCLCVSICVHASTFVCVRGQGLSSAFSSSSSWPWSAVAQAGAGHLGTTPGASGRLRLLSEPQSPHLDSKDIKGWPSNAGGHPWLLSLFLRTQSSWCQLSGLSGLRNAGDRPEAEQSASRRSLPPPASRPPFLALSHPPWGPGLPGSPQCILSRARRGPRSRTPTARPESGGRGPT